jgi:hypothetical protein
MGVKVAFQAEAAGETAGRPRFLVPARAVRQQDGSAVVFVVREERVERRAVAVGGTAGDSVELLSGVRAGEHVVLNPPSELADGSRVSMREADG